MNHIFIYNNCDYKTTFIDALIERSYAEFNLALSSFFIDSLSINLIFYEKHLT